MLYQIFKQHPIICTDSRKVEAGCLFFALKGENFDGNQYALKALEAGAAYAVVDDKNLPENERFIVVDDTLGTLQELANRHRRTLGIPIIALTGSNGKTTTKELLKRVLSTKYRVEATVGNLNNHIGVPLTLLSFNRLTQVGIVEMGANHLHEIEALCRIAEPNVGLITNVGRAHLEGFGSADGVRRGKGELYDYLRKSGGTAIYNAKDEALSQMVAEREGLHHKSYDPAAEQLELNIYGEYNQLNAQAAYAVGILFMVDSCAAKAAMKKYQPDNNRSQTTVTERNTLYMDAYNANPSSMRASIEAFAQIEADHKVVILGEMRELGEYAAEEHAAIVGMLDGLFEEVILVGSNFATCRGEYLHFNDLESLEKHLKINTLSNKHILIKGSRGVALEHIAPML